MRARLLMGIDRNSPLPDRFFVVCFDLFARAGEKIENDRVAQGGNTSGLSKIRCSVSRSSG